MKKFLSILALFFVVLVSGITLCACSEKDTHSDYEQNENTNEYSIILPSSTLFEIEADKIMAKEKSKVSLQITLKDLSYEISAVLANNVLCNQEDENTFTFTMPAKDVFIDVNLSQIKEILSTENVYYALENPTEKIAKSRDEDKTFAKDNFKISYKTSLINPQVSIFSTNQEIISNEAISDVINHKNILNNKTNYSEFTIDLSKINYGTTYLYINVMSDDLSININETLIKKIEVVEYGTINLDRWQETINLDLSSLNIENYQNLTILVTDSQPQYSCNYSFSSSINNKFCSFDIQYTPYHSYFVSVYYLDNNIMKFLIVNEAKEGNEEVGFNQYKLSKLTFCKDNSSINLKITN